METFTPAEDVLGEHENGTQYVVAAAGVPIPVAEAERLGILKSVEKDAPVKPKRVVSKKSAPEE